MPITAFELQNRKDGRVMAKQVCRECRARSFEPRQIRAVTQVAERFWSKVDKSGGPDSCWIWTGARRGPNRYGTFGVMIDGKQKQLHAHRYAFAHEHGPIPDGMFICHRCDNVICVNPAHLFLGTPRDNTLDMISKGRGWMQKAKKHRSSLAGE
jgi:hypothetical protein